MCIGFRYGEIVNINMVRDKKTGKTKGYGFVCYEDQRSTELAVDNFNGAKVKITNFLLFNDVQECSTNNIIVCSCLVEHYGWTTYSIIDPLKTTEMRMALQNLSDRQVVLLKYPPAVGRK